MIAAPSSENGKNIEKRATLCKILPTLRYEYLVAGVAGGTLSTLTVHPFDLLKIRLSVNDGHKGRPVYRGLLHSARIIWHTEGIRGFYQVSTQYIQPLVQRRKMAGAIVKIFVTNKLEELVLTANDKQRKCMV
ncbi:mitochondrial folate transporter/carrier-like [Tropilaelaps mercedesae]|uniref:Mitochondrial folate transporter/carrier-like n=1 Tax=Tropilaelaps mercedesae TaxID=418985 RepID=A0A1V9X2U1_9ACAR|nr:mitochondrial folate transporter/carrier-like [Tropilaelaps mercedesae]